MCISLEVSVASFLIGTLSAAYLYRSDKPFAKAFAVFMLFYTMIQLFEALLYWQGPSTTWSTLLLVNLALQGVVFFGAMKYFDEKKLPDRDHGFIVSCLLATMILFVTSSDEVQATVGSGICWKFLDNEAVKRLLSLMYVVIFLSLFRASDEVADKIAVLYIFTYILSRSLNLEKSPSYWCWLSALAAPVTTAIVY
jgi:hypothetical protein